VHLYAGHFPYAIRKILGPRGISTLHGKAHTQLRKILVPALSPKVSTKYVPHTVELAESACAEWAKANKMKGEDGMKAFTFQVMDPIGKCSALPTLTRPALRCPALPCPALPCHAPLGASRV